MKFNIRKSFSLLVLLAFLMPSCMTLDGVHGYRKKNKCCGVIKCDMHRRSQQQKRKKAVSGHKSLKKKEQRIKRGY